MVAKTPPKTRIMAPLNPNQLRETIKKVDQCMARLQELQHTVTGGNKVISVKNLSPRSARGYLRTSARCKQESLRIKNSAVRKSPVGKFQGSVAGEWKRMSLPAMLVGETVGEILQACQFTKNISATPMEIGSDDPRTPLMQKRNRNHNISPENTELRARRNREKQVVLQKVHLESHSPTLRRVRSRINFKVSSPNKRELEKENLHTAANRISPKHKPWAKKAVLFPNPLFLSTPASNQHKFCKTRSPLIPRTQQVPHKFLVKTPPLHSKFQVKMKNLPVSLSPTRANILIKKSPTRSPIIPKTQQVPHKFLVKSPPSDSKFQVKNKNQPVSLSPTRSLIIPKTQQVPHKFLVKSPASHSKFQVKIKSPPVSLSPTRTSILNKKSPTRSPKIPKIQQVPHKFLVKSPPSHSKFQVKIRNPPVSLSPTRASILKKKPTRDTILSKKSPTRSTIMSRKSPPRANISNKNSPKVSTATKLRRSLSPAKLASRFVSPLKNRMSIEIGHRFMSGLKQRQTVVF